METKTRLVNREKELEFALTDINILSRELKQEKDRFNDTYVLIYSSVYFRLTLLKYTECAKISSGMYKFEMDRSRLDCRKTKVFCALFLEFLSMESIVEFSCTENFWL